MIMDGLLLFSTAQNITTGTIASTNVVDLGNARDLGIGRPNLMVALFVTTGFATADSATMTVQFQGSTDNSTFSVYAQSRAYSAADLTVGKKLFPINYPAKDDNLALPRYVRLAYVNGSLNFTPGAVTASLVLDRQDNIQYPAGINITN